MSGGRPAPLARPLEWAIPRLLVAWSAAMQGATRVRQRAAALRARWADLVRRGAVPWPIAAILLSACAFAVSAEVRQVSRLSGLLDQERAITSTAQKMLLRESMQADVRQQALRDDLRLVEDEADHLYDLVRAIRTLGEQLRDRVGLPAPAIEPLPELPPRAARPISLQVSTTPEEARLAAEITGATSGGRLVLTSANGELLPPNTGPWPEGYVTPNLPPSQPARPTRLTQVSGVVARQWDSWQQLGQRIDQVLNQRSRASRPSIRPALGPITSGFGRRAGFWGVLAIHTGVDISLPIGTSVLSTADGVVTFSGWSAQGYGQTVQVRHDNGLVTLYGHLSRSLVSVGQSVSQGQPIALSGNSGISTGPHLHYEIRLNGVAVDPNRYW